MLVGMVPRFSFPQMDESVLKNGLRVIIIPDHEQEGMVAALQLPFGRFSDPVGQEGCAEICIGCMQKGTKTRTCEQFSDEFEHHGASIFAEVGEEHAMIGVKMLARFRDRLFPLFWEMITEPRFDSKELSRLLQEMVTALRAETVDAGTIASHHFFHEIAGDDHPAGRYQTIQSVKRLRSEQVVSFYKKNVQPKNGTLVIAGDFPSDWFDSSYRATVEAWRTTSESKLCEGAPVANKERVIRFVEKNDLTQVTLLVGQAAPGELDSARIKIALANYVFGAGNFSSRLMTRVRSSAGKTYGIASHIAAERRFGALTIATSTQNPQLTEVLTAILNEYDLFCKNGITADELEKAKRFASGNMAFQLEGLSNMVEKILWLRFYHRTNNYIETFDEMINGISLDSVNDAIRSCFDSEKLILIAVGKKNEIVSQLSQFGTPKLFHYKDRIR